MLFLPLPAHATKFWQSPWRSIRLAAWSCRRAVPEACKVGTGTVLRIARELDCSFGGAASEIHSVSRATKKCATAFARN
jgi:hypothetical protein